ncbi:MAG: hypothetical protein KAJ07_11155, partial [Planctomycetes bacterium]|nr:hypothetical protein [Planctomycetota bacterium]
YYDNEKITSNDIMQAQKKLNILADLGAPTILNNAFGSPTLTHILFPKAVSSVQLSDSLKQAVMQGQLNCSLEDIDEFFKQSSGRSELFWILLDAEAKKAGCAVSNEQAKEMLKIFLPQISQGRADAKMIIDSIISRHTAPEEEIFRIFGDLIGITTYAQMITDSEDVTNDQVKAFIARNSRQLSAEFVKISAANFAKDQALPTEEQLYQQFAKFKKYSPDRISTDNPYGFGYTVPHRAQLEYLFIKRSDVENTVDEPTNQQMEDYYRLNSGKYTYEEKIDQNDPESGSITNTKSYAEVSETIKRTIKYEKTQAKAEMIVNEAIEIIDAGVATLDFENATDEQIAAAAGNYADASRKINSKYKIPVHSNKTGLLSAADIANDTNLARLSLRGQSRVPVSIGKIIFAVDGTTTLSRFEVPTPRMFENIGPIRNSYGSIIGIVRVIKTEKEFEPSDFSLTYDRTGVELKESPARTTYSIREQAAQDIKTQKAMDIAEQKAEEFSKTVAQKGWDEAIGGYNKNNPTSIVRIENISNKREISQKELNIFEMLIEDDPSLSVTIQNVLIDNEQFARLSAIIPAGETEARNTMKILKFEAGKCCYIVKDVSITGVTEEDYIAAKNQAALQTESTSSQSLSVIHYLPNNILKRTSFRPAKEVEEEPEETDNQTDGAV